MRHLWFERRMHESEGSPVAGNVPRIAYLHSARAPAGAMGRGTGMTLLNPSGSILGGRLLILRPA